MFHELILKEQVNLPKRFTYPFQYQPHSLSLMAMNEVSVYLQSQVAWQQELSLGKMFGVLVVEDSKNHLGFLAAFSGQLQGSYTHSYFVPPIYDLTDPDGFFKVEEAKISAINDKIAALFSSDVYGNVCKELREKELAYNVFLQQSKHDMDEAKSKRDLERSLGVTAEREQALIRESQFMKAEVKRRKSDFLVQIDALKATKEAYDQEMNNWKIERKTRSAQLQKELFDQFFVLNAKGESTSLLSLFAPNLPPSGAGECAAPKLLQYAYTHQYRPICMAEFWWGDSPKTIVRKHLQHYPSCYAKCKPILNYMLQGLLVDDNPLLQRTYSSLNIVWEDEYLLLVNKPHGMLSVNGNIGEESVESLMQKKYPLQSIKAVHRLDMATSGLLLLSKCDESYVAMQKMFAAGEVHKRYVAILSDVLKEDKGVVDLPLVADVEHRPYQMVNREYGKPSVTHYEVIERSESTTKVYFYPQTGRTHQLRVHSAHIDGLNAPIVGDELYGTKSDRLYLQAQRLEFVHPITHKRFVYELPLEF